MASLHPKEKVQEVEKSSKLKACKALVIDVQGKNQNQVFYKNLLIRKLKSKLEKKSLLSLISEIDAAHDFSRSVALVEDHFALFDRVNLEIRAKEESN